MIKAERARLVKGVKEVKEWTRYAADALLDCAPWPDGEIGNDVGHVAADALCLYSKVSLLMAMIPEADDEDEDDDDTTDKAAVGTNSAVVSVPPK